MTAFASADENNVDVASRAMPKGVADRIDRVFVDISGQGWLQVRIAAAPADGRANEAIRRLLAKQLRTPPSAVALVRGAASRWKRFRVDGDPAVLMTNLSALAQRD